MAREPEQHMSPDASPSTLVKGAGVRRVNNVPLYLIGGAMTTFLVIMASVAANRGQHHQPAPRSPQRSGSAATFANAIVDNRKDGIIQAASLPEPPAPDPGHTAVAAPPAEEIDPPFSPPMPPDPAALREPQPQGAERNAASDEAARIRTIKLQQLDEAARASSSLRIATPHSAGASQPAGANLGGPESGENLARLAAVRQQIDASAGDAPNSAYESRVRMPRSGQGGRTSDDTASRRIQPVTPNNAANIDAGQGDRWRLGTRLEAPHTRFELRAGFVIPAILVSGINSELPGQIIAQVSQDVYDTASGQWRLVPQGARLVGTYSSDVAYGQARVLVAWQRIVFPDGRALDIGAMPGADSAGYAGFNDGVNNHYWKTFSSALLMSAVTAGIATSQRDSSGYGRPGFGSAMGEAVGQQLGQVTAQLVAKNLNIAPTLEIRPGYRFNVIVTKDIAFDKPYKPFDY